MKRVVLLVLGLAGLASAQAGRLSLVVTGCQNGPGEVLVALFDEAKGFPNDRFARHTKVATPANGRASLQFANLKPGRYAIAVFQDLNGNGELDTNLFGAPTEPYGFGNNARGTFSAPNFSEASIVVPSTGTATATVQVK